MRERLAILGGSPAINLDHAHYAQWPIYTEEEVETVSALIRNSGLSSAHYDPAGPIAQLERAIAERWGVRYVLTHHSGTAALNAALFGVGVVPGDEVIVQSATHPFSCIPIVGCGAVPVFADVDPHTRLLDPTDVERRITPRTKAILVVHWSGMPADMDTLLDVARRHGLRLVEDNCVSQSTLHRGRMCGTLADAGAISLQHGKLTSAGEGGVFFTDDPHVYQRAASPAVTTSGSKTCPTPSTARSPALRSARSTGSPRSRLPSAPYKCATGTSTWRDASGTPSS